MKLDLIRQLIESGVSWEQIAKLETDSTQETETVVVSENFEEKPKETETEQTKADASVENLSNSFDKMMENFATKLDEMNTKLSSFNQRFGEIEKRNLNERTTDDILAEILMPNGDKIIRGDK